MTGFLVSENNENKSENNENKMISVNFANNELVFGHFFYFRNKKVTTRKGYEKIRISRCKSRWNLDLNSLNCSI